MGVKMNGEVIKVKSRMRFSKCKHRREKEMMIQFTTSDDYEPNQWA